jgi:hypothetical protein
MFNIFGHKGNVKTIVRFQLTPVRMATIKNTGGDQWLTPVILAIWEAEIRRILKLHLQNN